VDRAVGEELAGVHERQAVAVLGLVEVVGGDEDGDPVCRQLVEGMVHCMSLAAGGRLMRLAQDYELVWATGWEEKANDYLPSILGRPELPVLNFDGAARFGSAHWKLGPLQEYGEGRPLAWIDDSFDESCYEWSRERDQPTLLVPTEPHLGLEEGQVEALAAWAKGL